MSDVQTYSEEASESVAYISIPESARAERFWANII